MGFGIAKLTYQSMVKQGFLMFNCSVMSDSATPWTVACQVPLSMGFSRQEYTCTPMEDSSQCMAKPI